MDERGYNIDKKKQLSALYQRYAKKERKELKNTLVGFLILIGCFCLFDMVKTDSSQDAFSTFIFNFLVWGSLLVVLVMLAIVSMPTRFTYLRMTGTLEYWRTPDIRTRKRVIRGEWVFLFNGILVHPSLTKIMLAKVSRHHLEPNRVYTFHVLWFEPPLLRGGNRHMAQGLIFSDFEPIDFFRDEPVLLK